MIATILLAVQFAQPFDFQYEYRARVIASENRLQELERHGRSSDSLQIRVEKLNNDSMLLERPLVAKPTATIPNLQVRTVCITSPTQRAHSQLSTQLNVASQPRKSVFDEALQKSARLNRWHISILEHQITHFNWSSSTEACPIDEQAVAQEVRPVAGNPMMLVSTRTTLGSDDLLDELKNELARRRATEQELQKSQQQLHAVATGVISISTPWELAISNRSINRTKLIGVLLLALVLGILSTESPRLVAFCSKPKQASVEFYSTMRKLKIETLTVVGQHSRTVDDGQRLLRLQARFLGLQMKIYRTSEWIMILCFALAIARFTFDSVWRELAIESPLAAIAVSIVSFR